MIGSNIKPRQCDTSFARCRNVVWSIVLLCCTSFALAKGVYWSLPDLQAKWLGDAPTMHKLWLTKPQRQQLAEILKHPYRGVRVRYWESNQKRLWVIHEIGKELPITYGVLTEAGQIKFIEVMEFRESRGSEIRSDRFRQQFHQARLIDEQKLDRNIDGITGATYSVRSMTKVAKMALLFDQWAQNQL